jgi:CheY-like chemotaxis protein
VLVVDDDPGSRALLESWLDGEGYRVRTASNGREALDILGEDKPSVMVVDLRMPVMDGATLRQHQRAIPGVSSVPFILVSGDIDAERVSREIGVSGFVAKPLDPDRLLSLVAWHCQRRH